jgi:hypothetical protein
MKKFKKQKQKEFKPLAVMALAEPHTYGITVVRHEDEETGEFIYRPILEIAASTSKEHCVLFTLNIFDTDLRGACYSAVFTAMSFCSDHYNEIAVFDVAGNLISDDQPDFTVDDLLDEILDEDEYIEPDDLSPNRKIH